jgi:hypothetical protein
MLAATVKGYMASKRVGQQGIQKRCVDLVTVDTVQNVQEPTCFGTCRDFRIRSNLSRSKSTVLRTMTDPERPEQLSPLVLRCTITPTSLAVDARNLSSGEQRIFFSLLWCSSILHQVLKLEGRRPGPCSHVMYIVLLSYDQFFTKYRSKGPSEHRRRVGFYEFCVTWDGFFASFLLRGF